MILLLILLPPVSELRIVAPDITFFYFMEDLKLVMNHVCVFSLPAGKYYVKFGTI